MSSKSRRKPGYTRPNRNRENLQLRGQIAQESSTDDVNEDIKVTQQVRNSGKAIQNSDGRSSHPAITRIGQSDQSFGSNFEMSWLPSNNRKFMICFTNCQSETQKYLKGMETLIGK